MEIGKRCTSGLPAEQLVNTRLQFTQVWEMETASFLEETTSELTTSELAE